MTRQPATPSTQSPAARAVSLRAGGNRHLLSLALTLLLGATLVGNGCSEGVTTPTAASTTGGTDVFSSVLNTGGTATRTFVVAVRGTVRATLAATAPQNVEIGFMIGIPRANGTGCFPNTSLATEASGTPQISVVADPGTFCAQVYDVGKLRDPISFTVTIEHP